MVTDLLCQFFGQSPDPLDFGFTQKQAVSFVLLVHFRYHESFDTRNDLIRIEGLPLVRLLLLQECPGIYHRLGLAVLVGFHHSTCSSVVTCMAGKYALMCKEVYIWVLI